MPHRLLHRHNIHLQPLSVEGCPSVVHPNHQLVHALFEVFFQMSTITQKFHTFALRMGEFNDIAQMLALLHELQGIDFVRQLRLITERHEFSPLKDDPLIYTVLKTRIARISGRAERSARDQMTMTPFWMLHARRWSMVTESLCCPTPRASERQILFSSARVSIRCLT